MAAGARARHGDAPLGANKENPPRILAGINQSHVDGKPRVNDSPGFGNDTLVIRVPLGELDAVVVRPAAGILLRSAQGADTLLHALQPATRAALQRLGRPRGDSGHVQFPRPERQPPSDAPEMALCRPHAHLRRVRQHTF